MVHVSLDPELSLRQQPERGHNRWHPDLEPVGSVASGDELLLDLRDSMDGEIGPDSMDEDVVTMPPISHTLTGPVAVEDALPGDLLELEILEYTTASFGWTAVIPGTGTLGDLAERPLLVRWNLDGGVARSEDLPRVAVPARTHAGVIGLAPSHELFEEAKRRELALAEAGHPVRLPDAATAFPPAVADGLRTTPPRENGGNLDVCDLVAGARLLLPVHAPGALLSAGDLHFAQGDGEVSMYAVETSGSVRFRVHVRKSPAWMPRYPAYEAPPRPPRAAFATTGIPIDESGENHFLDLGVATRSALLEMVGWLQAEHGFSFEQAYALCSVAVELRISQVVDLPNVLVSAALPLDVLET